MFFSFRSMCCCRHTSLNSNWKALLSWLTWCMLHRYENSILYKYKSCSLWIFLFVLLKNNVKFIFQFFLKEKKTKATFSLVLFCFVFFEECWEANASHIWDCTQQGMGSVDWQDNESLQDDWQENVSVHPSIHFLAITWGLLQGQQPKQGSPDFPLLSPSFPGESWDVPRPAKRHSLFSVV